MTTEQSRRLKDIKRQASDTANSTGARIAIVDELYCENDDDRFNYCPVTALKTLYRPEFIALIGVVYPNGKYETALDLLDELERTSR